MTIDRIDWHAYAENFPEDMPKENGGNHIGYFMEYLFKHDFLPDNSNSAVEEYLKVKNGEKTGLSFLIENCDGKFWDIDTNEEGLRFTNYVYDYYLSNLEKVLEYSTYFVTYSSDDYLKIENWLDEQYSIWVAKNRPILFQSVKKERSKNKFLSKIFNK